MVESVSDGKTAAKTAVSPKNGSVIPLGAHPKNTGGKKGRSGRRPSTFSGFIRSLQGKKNVQDAIKSAASDAESKGFGAVLKLMAEYDPERPAPPKQELRGEVIVRVVRD